MEQKLRSLDAVESWWFERLMAGTPTAKLDYWRADIPIDELFDDYIACADKIGIKRKSEMTSFGIKMRRLIPGLARERLSFATSEFGTRRVWCYVLPTLEDARALFETELSQAVAWGDESKP